MLSVLLFGLVLGTFAADYASFLRVLGLTPTQAETMLQVNRRYMEYLLEKDRELSAASARNDGVDSSVKVRVICQEIRNVAGAARERHLRSLSEAQRSALAKMLDEAANRIGGSQPRVVEQARALNLTPLPAVLPRVTENVISACEPEWNAGN